MNWQEVCDDLTLQNLLHKIELNRYGEVVMNVVRTEHSFYVEKILFERLSPKRLLSSRIGSGN